MSRRSAGRTNTSNDTYEDTGLPGSAKSGTRRSPTRPKPCGLPGCIATWTKSTPWSRNDSFDVVRPHAHPAAGDDDVDVVRQLGDRREDGGRVVVDRRLPDGRPARDDRGLEHVRVRLVDLPGPQRFSGWYQLGTGGDHGHPRTGPDQRVGVSVAASRATRRASTTMPAWRTTCPCLTSSPAGRTDVPTRAPARISTVSVPPSVSSTLTIASAPSGSIAPVMIRTASPGPTRRVATPPAATGHDRPGGPRTQASGSAPETSTARTAYPSIAELSKPGRSTSEVTSSPRTSPRQSGSGSRTGSGV